MRKLTAHEYAILAALYEGVSIVWNRDHWSLGTRKRRVSTRVVQGLEREAMVSIDLIKDPANQHWALSLSLVGEGTYLAETARLGRI